MTPKYNSTYKAYALGFTRGLHLGFWDDDDYLEYTSEEHHAAKAGYAAGIAHYCEISDMGNEE
jgi:hypothetical protein